jgi:heme-degrading monooxygenase HmoA
MSEKIVDVVEKNANVTEYKVLKRMYGFVQIRTKDIEGLHKETLEYVYETGAKILSHTIWESNDEEGHWCNASIYVIGGW